MREPQHPPRAELLGASQDDGLNMPMLSAVVTCYRDAPAILPMHRGLSQVFESLGVDYEILFVNDASPDDAAKVLAELAALDPHVLVIEHARNFGSQRAFVSGMELASGHAVILLDGDLQDPPELIRDFYLRWRDGYDVVYGRRRKREGSLVFSLLAAAFYRVFRGTAEVPMPLDAGDFSLMDRNVVDALLSCPERDPFLRGLRAWVGFSQIGVDYVRPSRAFGRSTHSFLKNFWWAKKGIFSFSSAPIEFLGYGAAFLTLMSLVALVERGIALLREPDLTPGIGLVLAVVAFLGSLNLLAVALVGEYVLRILEEARGRPRFIRKGIRLGEQLLTTKSQMDAFLNERQHRRTALQRRIPETVDEDAG